VTVHERLTRSHIEARIQAINNNEALDWATVEAMAFGSLLSQGFAAHGSVASQYVRYNVRISGQDVGRGTFSQRHLMIIDQETDYAYVPLNYLHDKQGHLEVANRYFWLELGVGSSLGPQPAFRDGRGGL
jgi:probable 2-oxoglutarate dehydrogenase E1 component DHKTD1